jgi:lipopolysaccharide export system protein LptA
VQTSQSDSLDLTFDAAGQLSSAQQTGHIRLAEDQRRAQADTLYYDAVKDRVHLTANTGSDFTRGEVSGGDPQVHFAAPLVDILRQQNWVSASGGVRTSMLPQNGPSPLAGASAPAAGDPLMNSKLPVDIASERMQMNSQSGVGAFDGNVRVSQGENATFADHFAFDRTKGTLDATGHVLSAFISEGGLAPGMPPPSPRSISGASGGAATQTGSPGANVPHRTPAAPAHHRPLATASSATPSGPAPVTITAPTLHYSEVDRHARYEKGVLMISRDSRVTCQVLDVYLAPTTAPGQTPVSQPKAAAGAPAAIERAVARGSVRITQPGRLAKAEVATYTFANDLITLVGGPPSIYDAEHGTLTGYSLTFSPSGETIRVESGPGIRTAGQYKVSR